MSYLGNKPSDVFPTSFTVTNATVEGTFTSQGIDDNADAVAITIDSSENVGIGTSSPDLKLDVSHGTSSEYVATFQNTADNLELKIGTTSGLLNIQGANASNNAAYQIALNAEGGNVGIGTSSPTGFSGYTSLDINNATNGALIDLSQGDSMKGRLIATASSMAIETASSVPIIFQPTGSEAIRIDSSGNLLVGTTGTLSMGSSTTAGFQVGGDFRGVRTDGNPIMYLKQQGNNGTFINFYKDTSSVGSIGTYSSNVLIGTGATGLRFYDGGPAILPRNPTTGANVDDTIDFGDIGNRFDNIFATNGAIQISDQQEKNTITDSDLGIDFIKRLTPKSYIFNGKTRTHYGLIAQDVETVLSDISKPTSGFAGFIKGDISEEQDGSEYRYGLRYTEFVAPLIQAVKDQQAIIEDLQARITALENA